MWWRRCNAACGTRARITEGINAYAQPPAPRSQTMTACDFAPAQSVAPPQRRRLLLFSNSVALGGMEAHMLLLARHLDREQFALYAICPAWPPTCLFNQRLAAAVDQFATVTPDRRYGVAKQMVETWRFFRLLRRWRIEVLHMHSTTYQGQWAALLIARLSGVKRIYVTEHLAPDQRLPRCERLVRSLFSRLVTGIVCVSEKNRRAREVHIYTPPQRTLVVANGVDPNDFTPIPVVQQQALRDQYDLPATAQIVGSVVRLAPEKGLDDLLSAFKIIRTSCPQAYLLLVGEGVLRETLAQQAAQLGIAEYVRFTGFQRDPRPFLSLMDVFVLPVPVGSMSIGLLEAMAMERAVVITFGGPGEAVEHGVSGFCAEPRNPAALAQAIETILHDSVLRQRLGAAAQRRVAEAFSAQRVARVLGALYQR
ncbi:MAG: glycosyltransferase family 1 protein [Candidatus Viridilinea halotolerans]|uniref:Glycosyltransferase family 1 protein n=1 Tax=Candidatus Viridilinea halotolerans TaxID=2491704 RepID=A0A426TWL1_9CHLR|nr:MAG: glycosyltransferase family 1 protein [Candidatus Viridilinea halotolerans]